MMKQESKSHEVTLLIVEDDDGHADLIQELLQDVGLHNPQIRFRDGQEVLDFLAGTNAAARFESGRRYLMLLDVRMPRVNGVDVLRRVKSHPEWKDLPVIMLTTTDDPREVQECYRLGCNFYVTKPVDFSRFATVLRQLGLFLAILQVPRADGSTQP